jgi:hypothetical protein
VRKNCSAWQARAPAHRACVRVDGPETALFDCNDIGRSGVQACRAPLCSSSPCAIQLANGGCPGEGIRHRRAESETDRCTATGRPDLRPPSNLAPLRLPLSSRSAWFDPLRPPAAHGPLPRHHTLTQLRRSREMSDELRCCVRTRVGGCSRCMACALQLANIFAILGPSTPNSLGIWDTRLRLHHTCCTARPAGMLPAGTGWSVVEFSSLPLL